MIVSGVIGTVPSKPEGRANDHELDTAKGTGRHFDRLRCRFDRGDWRMTEHLTERQRKWFASVREGLARETGKSLEDWVAIAHTCPETKPRAQLAWLKEHHGLSQNRASYVLSRPSRPSASWDKPDEPCARRSGPIPPRWRSWKRWTRLSPIFDGLITGQRKAYSAWSRAFQFAAAKPVKGGAALLGLAVTPDASPRLLPPRNESWSERLKAKLPLASPAEVDDEVRALLKAAWERS
jgi:hypothetical protein